MNNYLQIGYKNSILIGGLIMKAQKKTTDGYGDYIHNQEDPNYYTKTESEENETIRRTLRDTTLSFAIAYGGY